MATPREVKLSPEQLDVIETLDKNLCVSAGAGSGKTSVLVERFVHIVRTQKVDPERILAVTYTEKAANHMKEKLVKVFNERKMPEARRGVESAYIDTIHGFASRLLRENPLEADVAPDFGIIEEGEAAILMDDVLEEIVEEAIAREDVFDLFRRYGEKTVLKNIKAFYRQLRSFGKDWKEFSASESPCPSSLDKRRELSEEINAYLKGKEGSTKTSQNNRLCAAELLRRIPLEETPLEWERLNGLIEKEKEFRSMGSEEEKEAIKKIREAFDRAVQAEIEKAGQRDKELFLFLHEKFREKYDALKSEKSLLDFDDLLIKAHALLFSSQPLCAEVRKRYQEKFDYVLVDECQDTSRLQAEMIEKLTRAKNLFLVGDVKQSIYSFRNADVEIFIESEEKIRRDPDGKRIVLNGNYRSREEILTFVNKFFEKIWKEDSFDFDRLEPKREFGQKKKPCIEWLCVEKDEDAEEGMDKARIREARTLAGRIKMLVEEEKLLITERDGETRPVHYGDIVILFKALTDIRLYENELENENIPFFSTGSRGFYEKLEVRDLIHFLIVLQHPERDIPFASVLRSPLFGLSEDALYWFSRVKKGSRATEIPFSYGLEDPESLAKLGAEDREKVLEFKRLYGHLRASQDKLRISEILQVLTDETHYEAKLLAKNDGRRKCANVRKLLDIARKFQEREFFGLSDFISYVRELSAQETREAEAQLHLEKSEVVRLMSIHKAKGLEFPVVVLADLGRELASGGGRKEKGKKNAFNFTPEGGLGIELSNRFTKKWKEKGSTKLYSKSGLFSRNEESARKKEKQELKRLFYVALTRAEEHLILSGVTGSEKNEDKDYRDLPTWMDWLVRAFEAGETLGEERVFDFEGVPVRVLGGATLRGSEKDKKSRSSLSEISPFREALRKGTPVPEDLTAVSSLSVPKKETAEELLKAIARPEKKYYETRDLSVSALVEFFRCPGCYYDFYELRMPNEFFYENSFQGEIAGLLPRNEFGTLFHQWMQCVDLSRPFDEKYFEKWTEPLGLAPEDKEEIKQSSRSFLEGEWGKLGASARTARELPFIYKTSRGEVRGKIDLVVQVSQKEWIVLDYKTNRLSSEKELSEKAELYKEQLGLYSLALWEALSVAPAKAVLYFTALNRSVAYSAEELSLGEMRQKVEGALGTIARSGGRFHHQKECARQWTSEAKV